MSRQIEKEMQKHKQIIFADNYNAFDFSLDKC